MTSAVHGQCTRIASIMAMSNFKTLPEWIDDQKSSVLFSPFREKSLNPTSWGQKMNFWINAVLECSQNNNTLTVDLNSLVLAFERKGKYPKCLEIVLKEMSKTGKLITLEDFQKVGSSWVSWGYETFLKKPTYWGLSKLFNTDSLLKTEIYVVAEQVQKKSAEVLAHHHATSLHETTDNVLSLANFKLACSDMVKSDLDFDLVLKQLQLNKKAIVTTDKDGIPIIKLCCHSENCVQPIKEIELNIFRIQNVMKSLEHQIETLARQSDSFTSEAKKLVKEEKKALALHQLRKRRTLQQQIEKKSSCVDMLHNIIHRIEEASSNEMVFTAYESGLSAIRRMTGDLTVDKVDKVLDDLQQVLEEQEEISQALSSVDLPGPRFSQEDLELELQSILTEDLNKSRTNAQSDAPKDNLLDTIADLTACSLEDLPNVPVASPRSRSSLLDLPDVPKTPVSTETGITDRMKQISF